MVTATLGNYRQSPRKVRVVANLVRGKNVLHAINILTFTQKDASLPLVKLLKSALASAKNQSLDEASMVVKEIQVNKGVTLKRMMPRARGRGARINKRTSHVTLVLDTKESKVESPKSKALAAKK